MTRGTDAPGGGLHRFLFIAACSAVSIAFAGGYATVDGALPAQQRARELLDLHLQWRGGRSAFEALTLVERRGRLRIGDRSGTFRTIGSAAGFLRMDVKFDDVQQVESITLHGGWRWVNGDLTDLDDARIRDLRASIDQVLGRHLLLQGGYGVEHLGSESINDRRYEVLRFAGGGETLDLFIDPSDGSAHWSRSFDDDGAAWTRLADWREADGIRFAFSSDRRPDDPGRRQVTQWETIKLSGDFNLGEFLRPPAGSGTLEFAANPEWTPFNHFLDGYVELAGRVSGHEARVMLDSGAGITTLDRRFAEEIGLNMRRSGTIRGIGGDAQLFLADNVDVSVAGVTLKGATVAVLDLSEIGDMLGRDFQAVLGIEVFTRAIVALDYPNQRVAFLSPAPYEPPAGASSVRMYSRAGVPKVPCRFEDLPPALCDIDTGSNSAVDIVAYYVDEHDLLAGREPVSRVATGGVGGMIETPIATLRDFEFAGVSMGPMPAYFLAEAVGSLDTHEIAGNIGADLFRSFVLVFDYPGMRFHVIQEGERSGILRDRSGLQNVFRGDHVEVFFVSPGSPAAAAGFRKGLRITAINGEPIGPAYLESGFRWRYDDPGTVVLITLDTLEVHRIVLADFY